VSKFRDLAADSLNDDAEQVIAGLKDILNGAGSVTRRFACEHCGQANTVRLEVADTKTMLDVARFLAEQGLGKSVPVPASSLEHQRDAVARRIAQGKVEMNDLSDHELNLMCFGDPDDDKTVRETLEDYRKYWHSHVDELQALVDEIRSEGNHSERHSKVPA
jgi:hypothetical protein